ncbi:MAG: translation initiation factor IF-3 [Armatimonadetes bacterium]|nr:translation initiation factor IF-3 [Armatimonadota bacterium]MBS1702120.1 translation initiation factor IF-3 [Armatimonadota bacterium]MBS1728038.1 translation initiation factor IF-3 [Armatimonadota bacterium]
MNGRLLRFPELRVIGSDGSQLGVISSRDALNQAREEGMDLILVAAQAAPPVAKIADYGKHKYLEGKQGRDKKPKGQETKGIKISPRIAEHDMEFLSRNARKFLEHGDKVKVTCMFRQRELTHPENGKKRLDAFAAGLEDCAIVERQPQLDGRQMIMILNPKPGARVKDAKNSNVQDGSEEV